MIFLYVFLGIILFLLFLLCCPVFVTVSFKDYLKLQAKFLFFSFELLPKKKYEKFKENDDFAKKSKNLNSDLENSKFFSIIKEKGFFGFLKILKLVSEAVFGSAKKIYKKIHLISVNLYLLVASENAADTAIDYVKVYSLVSCAKKILLPNFDEKKCDITIISGFNKSESKVDFSSKFYFFPISALSVFVGALFKFVKNLYVSACSEGV